MTWHEWVSPNGVTHLVTELGGCATCGHWHQLSSSSSSSPELAGSGEQEG